MLGRPPIAKLFLCNHSFVAVMNFEYPMCRISGITAIEGQNHAWPPNSNCVFLWLTLLGANRLWEMLGTSPHPAAEQFVTYSLLFYHPSQRWSERDSVLLQNKRGQLLVRYPWALSPFQ